MARGHLCVKVLGTGGDSETGCPLLAPPEGPPPQPGWTVHLHLIQSVRTSPCLRPAVLLFRGAVSSLPLCGVLSLSLCLSEVSNSARSSNQP